MRLKPPVGIATFLQPLRPLGSAYLCDRPTMGIYMYLYVVNVCKCGKLMIPNVGTMGFCTCLCQFVPSNPAKPG